MYIKVWRHHSVPVRYPERAGEEPRCRPISWIGMEAQRFTWELVPRESVLGSDEELNFEADEVVLGLYVGEEELVLDEVCVLKVEAPYPYCVVFDTEAYICNESGDTVETIRPRREVSRKLGGRKPKPPGLRKLSSGPQL